PTNELRIIAGTGVAGTGFNQSFGDGGPARAARLSSDQGVALTGAGELLIVSTDQSRIRRVLPSATTAGATIDTICGRYGEGPAQGQAPGADTVLEQAVGLD